MQREEKAIAIAEHCYRHAQATGRVVKALYDASRKKPRLLSKNTGFHSRLLRKRRICLLTASIAMQQYMGAMQLQIILSQPIPKFKPGGITNNEQAEVYSTNNTISESKQEYFTNPFSPSPDAIQSLPIGQRGNI